MARRSEDPPSPPSPTALRMRAYRQRLKERQAVAISSDDAWRKLQAATAKPDVQYLGDLIGEELQNETLPDAQRRPRRANEQERTALARRVADYAKLAQQPAQEPKMTEAKPQPLEIRPGEKVQVTFEWDYQGVVTALTNTGFLVEQRPGPNAIARAAGQLLSAALRAGITADTDIDLAAAAIADATVAAKAKPPETKAEAAE